MLQMKSRRWYYFFHAKTFPRWPGFHAYSRRTTLGRSPVWTSLRPEAETSTSQYATLKRERYPNIGRIRTRNPSKQAISESRLIGRAATGIGSDDNVYVYCMFSISCFVRLTKW